MEYPKHLNQKIRKEIAISYIQHEFKKLFPSISQDDIKNLTHSKELCLPRDFWNGLHGISMGFKLKIGLIYLITAENIKIKKEKIDIKKLTFGTNLEQTKILEKEEPSALELINFYKKNKKIENNDLKKVIKIRGKENNRENDPIVVFEKIQNGKKFLSVYDGNGRLGRHILEDKKKINAFIGKYTTEDHKPINYWLPTSLMMDILFFVYQAIDVKDKKLIDLYMKVLKNMLKNSESGKYELMNRAITGKEPYRTIILKKLK